MLTELDLPESIFIVDLLSKLSIEETYKEQISVLKEQNERKDARIKLLEQKIQRLQVNCFLRQVTIFSLVMILSLFLREF